jgi:hypothetical protein
MTTPRTEREREQERLCIMHVLEADGRNANLTSAEANGSSCDWSTNERVKRKERRERTHFEVNTYILDLLVEQEKNRKW